jgi:hypothetical protein
VSAYSRISVWATLLIICEQTKASNKNFFIIVLKNKNKPKKANAFHEYGLKHIFIRLAALLYVTSTHPRGL